MMKNKFLIILLLVLVLFLAGCKEIDKEEAFIIAKDFVDTNIKFYVSEDQTDNGMINTPKVSIKLIDVYKEDKEWYVKIYVQSNSTGETKENGLIIPVDARTGEINKEKMQTFIIESRLS